MEYVCGGYFLTKRSGCRVPGTNFVTLSPNHTYFFPDSWAISWVGETDIERFHCATALGIPESMDLLAIVPFGYPKQRLSQGRKDRKPPAEVVSRERYGQPFA